MIGTLELILAAAMLPLGAGLATQTVASQPALPAASAPADPARPQEASQAPQPPPTAPDPAAGRVVSEPAEAQVSPSSTETRERLEPRGGNGHDVVRVGSGYRLAATDSVAGLVVIMGDATIEGHVADDVAVVLGEIRLGPSAVVDGDLVLIGGNLSVQDGAVVGRDLVVVGGSLDTASRFKPGGQQVVVGFRALGDGMRRLLPWLSGGLLLGRPIVPSLPWVWMVVGVVFLIYLGVMLVFEQPVRASADVLAGTPLRALATGMATIVLTGPIVLLLAATVVGLLAIPFALLALVVAGLIGRIAAARWLGTRLVSEGDATGRGAFVRSFVVGSAILVLAYTVPVLGGVVWAVVGAAGLGASVLAFAAAYRKENPATGPVTPPISTLAAGDQPAPMALDPSQARSSPTAASSPTSLALLPRASFFDRLAAFVLDGILVALVIAILPTIDDDTFIPLFVAYRFAMWVWKGVTVGGIICQLRIVRVDGQPMSGGEALVRSFVSLFSVVVLGIGCFWMLRDPDGQTWHDRVAGTIVVKVPRNWPL